MKRSRRLPLDQLAPNLLQLAPEPGLLTSAAIFGNPRPQEIEVGCGKGLFLLEAARAHPEVNYLGIEIDRKHQLFAATRMAKRGLVNVRIACADARLFLRDRAPAASCQALHIYFPDPWWKRRHRKRRLFTEEFARHCERVLAPGGQLFLATDVEEYFQIMIDLVASATALVRIERGAGEQAIPLPGVATNFESKALAKGSTVYRAAFRQKSPDGSFLPIEAAKAQC